MVGLAMVGAVVVTAALIAFTFGFYGIAFFVYGMSGFDRNDYIALALGTLVLSEGWLLWWRWVGSTIHISFS